MIYSEDNETKCTNMHNQVYLTGQPDVMTEMIYMDGPCIRRLCLNSEHVERFLATTKEAGLA